jgi:hypothetical protein
MSSEDVALPEESSSGGESSGSPAFAEQFEAIALTIRQLATAQEGDVHGLLASLRLLEKLHREIEDGPFRRALPPNRQALYALLRDMETEGGWPYIPRLRLKQIMHWIEELEDHNDA